MKVPTTGQLLLGAHTTVQVDLQDHTRYQVPGTLCTVAPHNLSVILFTSPCCDGRMMDNDEVVNRGSFTYRKNTIIKYNLLLLSPGEKDCS